MELAIDTSTEIASIALSQQGQPIAELSWPAGQNHTVDLTSNIIQLLEHSQAELQQVQAVFVARGPGSFNGLRVGVAMAKGFAFSLDIPIVGISTLEAEALPHAATGLPIQPVQAAGRGEIATALYQQQGDEWRRLVEEHITTIDELHRRIESKTIICGRFSSDAAELPSRIKDLLGGRAVIENNEFCRAGYLAELGWRRLERGDRDNISTLQPLYLRRPAITKPKKDKP